jgi:hypothetical protein
MSEDRTYKSKSEVLTYLVAQGYIIKQSAFYEKAKYWLHPDAGRTYTLRAVEKFIEGADLKRAEDETASGKEAGNAALRKAAAEANEREERARLLEMKRQQMEGELVKWVDVEYMLTARAVNLHAGLKNLVRSRIEDFVLAVAGDLDRAGDGMRLWESAIDELLDRYAREGEIKAEARSAS